MASDNNDNRKNVGRNIRDLRIEQGQTLKVVADAAKIAVSTLSKIERGLLAPSYERFSRIARSLGVEIGYFHATDGKRFAEGEFLVSRAGEHTLYQSDSHNYELLFADSHGKSMLPALCTLMPLDQLRVETHNRHPGQEFIHVLEGTVAVHLENRPPVILEQGDSAYFDARRGHIYSAAGAEPARVLFLLAPGTNAASEFERNLAQLETELI